MIVIIANLVVLSCIHSKCVWKIADSPNYGSVLIFIGTMGDFWSDVLFSLMTLLRDHTKYFYASLYLLYIGVKDGE